jgi:hypothetical protein
MKVLRILLIALLPLSFGSCGSKSDNSSTQATEERPDEQLTERQLDAEAIDDYFELFKEGYPPQGKELDKVISLLDKTFNEAAHQLDIVTHSDDNADAYNVTVDVMSGKSLHQSLYIYGCLLNMDLSQGQIERRNKLTSEVTQLREYITAVYKRMTPLYAKDIDEIQRHVGDLINMNL